MDSKKGALKTILLTLIAIVVVLIIGSVLYTWKTTGRNPIQQASDQIEKITNPGGTQNPDTPPTSSETGTGGGSPSSSSGSSGGGSGSSSSGGVNCYPKNISYSLENPARIYDCHESIGDICINKTINCSIQVRNRDPNLLGYFQIQTSFIEDGKNKTTGLIYSEVKEITIQPQKKSTLKFTTTIQSTGEDGIANKDINCFYNTLGKPYGEIC